MSAIVGRRPNENGDEFKRGLGVSILVHIVLFIGMTVKLVFFEPKVIDFSQAIRVDMVGLPDKIPAMAPAELKKPEAAKEVPEPPAPKPVAEKLPDKVKPVPVKTEPDAVNLKKVKDDQKKALEKLKKLSAIDRIKQEVSKEAQEKQAQEAAKVVMKGRVISAGTALTGLDKIESNNYLQGIDQKVKQQWALPQWLIDKPLRAQILVKFNVNGELLSSVVRQSSGNPTYDSYCLQAVRQAAPFPKAPDKFAEKFGIDGVVIGFPE